MRRQNVEHLLAILDPTARLDRVAEHGLLAVVVQPWIESKPEPDGTLPAVRGASTSIAQPVNARATLTTSCCV